MTKTLNFKANVSKRDTDNTCKRRGEWSEQPSNILDEVKRKVDLRIRPQIDSRMFIRLCRMKCMPIIHPILSLVLSFLENDFVHVNRQAAAVLSFYYKRTKDGGAFDIDGY